MATSQILNLARRSRRSSLSLSPRLHRSFSTSPAVSSTSEIIGPPAPNVMIYDRLAESMKSKIKKLEKPDPRFLQHNSPHPVTVDHTNILSEPETRVTTLPNGLRVATESNTSLQTATVGLWIDAGSRYESEETHGTAHFLERLLFKGTYERTQKSLEEEIENMGGHFNAYTSREQTIYYAKVMGNDVAQTLDILADTLQKPAFDCDDIERERDVFLRKVERHPEDVIFDHLHATAFQYSPLGRTIMGPADNINAFHREVLWDYIKTQYTASRMVIVAAGM